MATWDMNEYSPVCVGDGWVTTLLYWPAPDHAFEQDTQQGAPPGQCTCGHTDVQHVIDGPGSDAYRIQAVRVLNLTPQRQRMVIGDARTQVDSAWVTPWFEPGDDYDMDVPKPSPGAIYFTHAEQPYRFSCT